METSRLSRVSLSRVSCHVQNGGSTGKPIENGNQEKPYRFTSHRSQPPLSSGVGTMLSHGYRLRKLLRRRVPFDNTTLILNDARVHSATVENLELILDHTYWWPYGESGLYRPVTTISYLFNYAVLGNRDNPIGYHCVNFILHLLNFLLVFAQVSYFTKSPWPSAFVVALWAVHPVLTESVTNIIGRADLLAGLAVMGGFLLYLRGFHVRGPWRLAWLAGLFAASMLGAFSKESGVALLGVLFLYEAIWWKERRSRLNAALGLLAVLTPILLMLYQRTLVLATSNPVVFPFADNPIVGAGFWTGRLTATAVCLARAVASASVPRLFVPGHHAGSRHASGLVGRADGRGCSIHYRGFGAEKPGWFLFLDVHFRHYIAGGKSTISDRHNYG